MVDGMTPAPDLSELIRAVEADAGTEEAADLLATASTFVADLESVSDALLGHFVDRCRVSGMSWSEISAALGVSKQAAHKRFSLGAPTFERFTQRARSTLEAAAAEATSTQADSVRPAHLLLGLYAEPKGLAAEILAELGVDRAAVLAVIPPGDADRPDGTRPPFATSTKEVLRSALLEALELGHNYIGTEHLLLGLLRDETTPVARLLDAHGAGAQVVRAKVAEILAAYQAPKD
jgi:hypothetical protein